jgi:toxin ParE1/3/4
VRLDVSVEAQSDIRGIYAYSVRHWGRDRAGDYLDHLRERMTALARGELSGTAADDVAPGMRRQLAGSHAIWFRIAGDRIRVVRVLHQSRDGHPLSS